MPLDNGHVFLFATLNSKQPSTARKVHIRRLYDILQLSLLRQDFARAQRAWAILARCKEVDWKALWSTGLQILEQDGSNGEEPTIEYLRSMMLQFPEERPVILKELVFRLLLDNNCRVALDELELYLPSFPYQENPTLHIYAGLSAMYLAQDSSGLSFNSSMLRQAQTHFEHALIQDPANEFAEIFIDKISVLQKAKTSTEQESEDENMTVDDIEPDRKRIRS
ncbi:hypothetical protein D9619_000653 [Psilocybe cf. subviscida]|uniref:Uncharacterized protein n=1 Tax=Psilocybe cf. subviscida TaxID=2480587 RepID=A0A8H5BEB7_9AGAR|nr:hypothetical protein D9619_000653 [Psilocybe cf. subviscida]